MKKLLPNIAAALFGLFILAVFVAVVSVSFSGLGRIFPDNIFNQSIGLVLFDFAALVWFLVFVAHSKSAMQYVFAGGGFLLGVLGVLGLAGMEVGISSGWLIAADMTRPLSYVFIAALIGHLVLIYMHHGSSPKISSQISLGIEMAKIEAEGMRQAELQLAQQAVSMGDVIRARLFEEVLQSMNMDGKRVIDLPALPMMPTAQTAEPTAANDLTRGIPVEMPRQYPADARGTTDAPAPLPPSAPASEVAEKENPFPA